MVRTSRTPGNSDANPSIVIDQYDIPDATAVGLALENVNFGLILMRPAADKATSIRVKATANFAGLVGIDDFTLSASGIDVEYNTIKKTGANSLTPVVDFAQSFPGSRGEPAGYKLDTGNGELLFDAPGRVLRASVADAELQIGSYVFVRGAMAFEKGPDVDVTLTDGLTSHVSSMSIGAQGLTMFFGANGPYWTDLDGNGSVSWSFKTGTTDASRRVTSGSVTIGATTYTSHGE